MPGAALPERPAWKEKEARECFYENEERGERGGGGRRARIPHFPPQKVMPCHMFSNARRYASVNSVTRRMVTRSMRICRRFAAASAAPTRALQERWRWSAPLGEGLPSFFERFRPAFTI